jgi:quercetin dioxygenase-like cupin family protein
MSTNDSTNSRFWSSIATMPSITPIAGVTMYPTSGENMMINLVRLEPGAVVPLHSHFHEQGGTVIEGAVFMTIEGETKELRAGDVYIAPPDSVHGAEAGPEGCLIADVFSPPREDYKIPAE